MSDELIKTILQGVISGLITSLVIFIFAYIWKETLQPKLEDIAYTGTRVDGKWSLIQDDKYSQMETLELKQCASKLTGTLTLVPKKNSQLKTRTLNVTGTIKDRFVMLNCSPSDNRGLGYVSYLGAIEGSGPTIKGHALFYDINDHEIQSVEADYEYNS